MCTPVHHRQIAWIWKRLGPEQVERHEQADPAEAQPGDVQRD